LTGRLGLAVHRQDREDVGGAGIEVALRFSELKNLGISLFIEALKPRYFVKAVPEDGDSELFF
jgi:hypothetical protein